MIEKWQSSVGGGGQAGTLLTVLAKTFDLIYHKSLIEKLYPNCFVKNYSFVFKRTETKNQNKFLSQRICWDSFRCSSEFYIRTTSFLTFRWPPFRK